MALEAAANETQPSNRVFSPQNWIKAKTCLAGINFAIRNYFSMLPLMPQGGKEMKAKLDAALSLETEISNTDGRRLELSSPHSSQARLASAAFNLIVRDAAEMASKSMTWMYGANN